MKQPIKNNAKKTVVKATEKRLKETKKGPKKKSHHFNYGTSKLEADFVREFLDKLELKYIYQYEAKEIGRYFDFAVTSYPEVPFEMEVKDGIECVKQEGQNVPISFIIEVDGG